VKIEDLKLKRQFWLASFGNSRRWRAGDGLAWGSLALPEEFAVPAMACKSEALYFGSLTYPWMWFLLMLLITSSTGNWLSGV
jgi:hypothetical protein